MLRKTCAIMLSMLLVGMPMLAHAKSDMKSYKIKRLVTQLYDRKAMMDAKRQLLSYGSEVTEYLVPVIQDESGEKSAERAKITALRIISSVGGSGAEDAVVKLLADKNYRVRQEAAKALSVIAKKRSSISPLKDLFMHDANANVRFNAIKALVKLAPEEETDLFVNALGDRDARIRRFAVIALGNIKSVRAIPSLTQLVRDPDANVRLELARALAKIDNTACLASLKVLIMDSHPNIRMLTIREISRSKLKGVDEILVSAADSSDGRVASLAIIALAERNSGSTVEVARKHFNDERLVVRMAAIEAVGKMGGEAEKPLLEVLLKSESSRVRKKAEEAMANIRCNLISSMSGSARQAEIEELINILAEDNPRVRVAAIIALGNLKSVEAVPSLSRLVNDPSVNVRLKLAVALANIDTKDCLEPLVKLMGDSDESVRTMAAQKLSQVEAKGTESILVSATDSKNSRTVGLALTILAERRSVKALELAKEHLDDKRESVRLAAIEVLGRMGGEKEKPLLGSLSRADSSKTRQKAKKALEEINSRI